MLFDLHVHTAISACGEVDIGELVQGAKARGLDGICITDHDTMDIRHAISEGRQDNGLIVIFGMEYTTDQGDFLIFGPFEDLPPKLPADLLLRTVALNGGVAVAAHPFRVTRPADEQLIRQGLCRAIECLNGRNSFSENRAVGAWRERYAVAACGGSDAHTLDELATFATRFFVPVNSRAELIRALRHRLCQPEIPAASRAVSSGAPAVSSLLLS